MDSENRETQANKVAVYELKDLPEDRAVYVKEGSLFFRSSKEDALLRLKGRLNKPISKPLQ